MRKQQKRIQRESALFYIVLLNSLTWLLGVKTEATKSRQDRVREFDFEDLISQD